MNICKKEESFYSNLLSKAKQSKFIVRATKHMLFDDKLINLKLRFEQVEFERNFDYLLKCSKCIKDYSNRNKSVHDLNLCCYLFV